jgi:hypothetical protein
MIKACERRILEFPLGMEAREIAKELKREGWFAWASDHESIILRIERVRANDTERDYGLFQARDPVLRSAEV